MGRRNRCTFGRALLCTGLAVFVLMFCSFEFICTVAAAVFIIIGLRMMLC